MAGGEHLPLKFSQPVDAKLKIAEIGIAGAGNHPRLPDILAAEVLVGIDPHGAPVERLDLLFQLRGAGILHNGEDADDVARLVVFAVGILRACALAGHRFAERFPESIAAGQGRGQKQSADKT